MHEKVPVAFHHLFAIAAAATALAVRGLLDPWLGSHLALVTVPAAVAAAVWFGGYRAALLTAAVGYLGCDYLFIEPRGAFALDSPEDMAGLAAYLVTCSIIIGLGQLMRRAQRRAQAGQELLGLTLASVGDAAIATDTQGRITYLNAVAESVTGWSLREALGQPLDRVLRALDEQSGDPLGNPAVRRLREGGSQVGAHHARLVSRDGTERPIEHMTAPISDARGKLLGCVLIFRDITARRTAEKELRDAEERMRSVVNTVIDGIITIDERGTVQTFNPAAERIFGFAASEVIGQNVSMLSPDPYRREHEDYIANYLRTGEAKIIGSGREVVGRRKDGSTLPMELAVSDLRIGPERWFTGIVRDVTERKRAEESMRESEQRLRLALEAGRMGTWEWNVDTNELVWSSGLKAMRGLSPRARGAIFADHQKDLHPEDRARVLASISQAVQHDQSHHVEYRIVRPDGTIHWIEESGLLFQSEAGAPARMIGICVDVTHRKQAEEALRQRAEEVEKLMEVMPVAVWIARDPACTQITGNRAGYKLLRVPVGLNLSKSAPPGEQPAGFRVFHAGKEVLPEELPMQYAAAHGVEVRDYEEDIVFQDGAVVQAFGSAMPLFDEQGKVRGSIAAFMDVSELRRLERELRQKVEELAAADRRKDQFLATLAHELRNPLAPIGNAVHILLAKGPPDPELRWAREVIDRQVRQMTRLLDDLLDASRISYDKLELRRERIDLTTVIQMAVETSRPLIEGGGHELTVTLPGEPVHLDADPVRLAQILSNLLNNAAKYTEPGGHIRLTGRQEGDEVVVSVQDDGIGVPAEMLPAIFDVFSQAKLQRSLGGLGIGLSLARGLTELHGGRIEARSDGDGKGSEFVIRLPRATADAALTTREADRNGHPPTVAKRRLLIVDDLRDSADTLATLLTMMGHEVHTAYDGEQAIAAAEQFRPDAVLLDIGMPKLNGYEACRRIRKQPWGRTMFLIAVTGWGQDDDRRRTAEAGFDHHMVKPLDPALLNRLLASS